MSNTAQIERMKTLLQPDVVAELGARVRGPVDLLQLREQLEQWRWLRGEEAAAPAPVVERVIAFKPETWEQLNGLAAQFEWNRFLEAVTDWELDRYFEVI